MSSLTDNPLEDKEREIVVTQDEQPRFEKPEDRPSPPPRVKPPTIFQHIIDLTKRVDTLQEIVIHQNSAIDRLIKIAENRS